MQLTAVSLIWWQGGWVDAVCCEHEAKTWAEIEKGLKKHAPTLPFSQGPGWSGNHEHNPIRSQAVFPACSTVAFLIPNSAATFLEWSPGVQPSAPVKSLSTHSTRSLQFICPKMEDRRHLVLKYCACSYRSLAMKVIVKAIVDKTSEQDKLFHKALAVFFSFCLSLCICQIVKLDSYRQTGFGWDW